MDLLPQDRNVRNRLALILAALLIVGIWGGIYWDYKRPKAYAFTGKIEKVEGSSVLAAGFYVGEQGPYRASSGSEDRAEILVTPETKIIKTVWMMPSNADLEKTGGRWDPNKLKKENKEVSIEDLRDEEGIPILVKTERDIFRKAKFQAQVIQFLKQEYPASDIGRPAGETGESRK